MEKRKGYTEKMVPVYKFPISTGILASVQQLSIPGCS